MPTTWIVYHVVAITTYVFSHFWHKRCSLETFLLTAGSSVFACTAGGGEGVEQTMER
jgi:hypothetical protein